MEEHLEFTTGNQPSQLELSQSRLISSKPLNALQGSFSSSDNDSDATMSDDETLSTSSIVTGHGRPLSTGDVMDTFSPRTSGLPVSRIHVNMAGHQTHSGFHQGITSNNQTTSSFVSSSMQAMSSQAQPSSAGTEVVQGRMGQVGQRLMPGPTQGQDQVRSASSLVVDVEMIQSPSSREIPVVKEAHGNVQGSGMDLSHSKIKTYSRYYLPVTPKEQPSSHRPSSVQSEPGYIPPSPTMHGSLSPNVLPQPIGFGNIQTDKSPRQACVRDLICSAIERNLRQSVDKLERNVSDKRTSEPVYSRSLMMPVMAQQFKIHDLRKEKPDTALSTAYSGHHSASPYPVLSPRGFERDPHDSRNSNDLPQDFSKGPHGYQGYPRDRRQPAQFQYRRQPVEQAQRRNVSAVLPPPGPAYSQRPAPYPLKGAISLTNRHLSAEQVKLQPVERETTSSPRGTEIAATKGCMWYAEPQRYGYLSPQQVPSAERNLVLPHPLTDSTPSPHEDTLSPGGWPVWSHSPNIPVTSQMNPNHPYMSRPAGGSITQGAGRSSVFDHISGTKTEQSSSYDKQSQRRQGLSPSLYYDQNYVHSRAQQEYQRKQEHEINMEIERKLYEQQRRMVELQKYQEKEIIEQIKMRNQQMPTMEEQIRKEMEIGPLVNQRQEHRPEIDSHRSSSNRSSPGYDGANSNSIKDPTDIFKCFSPDQSHREHQGEPFNKTASQTAADLIDAIIRHQINQRGDEMPSELKLNKSRSDFNASSASSVPTFGSKSVWSPEMTMLSTSQEQKSSSSQTPSKKRWMQSSQFSSPGCSHTARHTPKKGDILSQISGNENSPSNIPPEILMMDERSIQVYQMALRSGKEKVYHIRLNVVGPFGVGKTSLINRLLHLGFDIESIKSTNGVDVHNFKCAIDVLEGEWILDGDEIENTKNYDLRLGKVLLSSYQSSKERDESSRLQRTNNLDEEDEQMHIDSEPISQTPNISDGSSISQPENELNNPMKTKLKQVVEALQKCEQQRKCGEVSIWDFGGQFIFYSTHQTFLSHRGIYLVVMNISKTLADTVKDDKCFMDNSGVQYLEMGEYILFWLKSIHTYGNKDGLPPVILVATHLDQLEFAKRKASELEDFQTISLSGTDLSGEDEPAVQKRKLDFERSTEDFFDKLRDHIQTQGNSLHQHLADEDFAIDNTIDDPRLKDLCRKIYEIASKQSYWGEEIPASWINLEKALMGKRLEGNEVISFQDVVEIDKKEDMSIEKLEQLDLFLRFQHSLGNIIYFSEENLRNFIILRPQWLIDAFKCLVTVEQFCKRKLRVIWREFNSSAILKDELIDAVWKDDGENQFHKNKVYLLNTMERLDIIAKPEIRLKECDSKIEKLDYYLVPCMLKETISQELICSITKNATSTPYLCFVFENAFVPPAVFHRLLAACMREWCVASQRQGTTKKLLLFCGCGIFDLDVTTRLLISMNEDYIKVQVFSYGCNEEVMPDAPEFTLPDVSVCTRVKEFVEKSLTQIIGRYQQHMPYELYIKCKRESGFCEGLFSVEKLLQHPVLVCHEQESHAVQSANLLKFWFCSNDDKHICQSKRVVRKMFEFSREDVLGYGSHGTIVFRGKFQIKRPVAIKQIRKDFSRMAEREIDSLLKIDKHENILRYISQDSDDDHIYIVLELAKGHLKDIVKGNITSTISERDICWQILNGISFLHQNGIVHRDVKTENVLIVEVSNRDVVKLGDFGLGKSQEGGHNSVSLTHGRCTGTSGYISPEISGAQDGDRITDKVDIFSAGVTMYYVETKGSHPFHDPSNPTFDYHHYQTNISNGNGPYMDELKLQGKNDLHHLLSLMLERDPNYRPSAPCLMSQLYFWPCTKQKDFICLISDEVERRICCANADAKFLSKQLEVNAHDVIGKDWMASLDSDIYNDIHTGRKPNHDGTKIISLIRALRNLIHHIGTQSQTTQDLFGHEHEKQIEYIKAKYPKLLLHLFLTVKDFLSTYTNDEIQQNKYLKKLQRSIS